MDDCIIVRSRIKEQVEYFKISKDYIKELDRQVKKQIEKSKERAKLNGRTTLMKQDL